MRPGTKNTCAAKNRLMVAPPAVSPARIKCPSQFPMNGVRPALRTCISLVGFFDRFLYGLSHVTSSEKWDALVELAAELYPTGPNHDGLWERAGGRDSDLGWGGNGRSRWRDALGRIRRG